MPTKELLLASASPRRHEILSRLTDAFEVEPADIDETPHVGEPAAEYVVRLAAEKAHALARPGRIVIGADTSVVLDGVIVGKPIDPTDAASMLRRLSGRSHEVMTGVALVVTEHDGATRCTSGHEVTRVEFDELTESMIEWYVATGEADDKAGGYGLQGAGALFADTVHGSVSNVIGLPLALLHRLALEVDIDLLDRGHRS